MRRALLILLPLIAIAAAILYIFLPPATATFFLFAGVIVSICAASTTLLGAYSRHKEIAHQNKLDEAEQIAPRPGDDPPP